jgi:Ca2+-binding EF-hand superfamily protein
MARWLALLVLALSLIIVLVPAWGGDDTKKAMDLETYFKKLDTNSDGRVTKPEFLKLASHFKDRTKAKAWLGTVYDQIDTERKGITREQLKQYLDNKRKKNEK